MNNTNDEEIIIGKNTFTLDEKVYENAINFGVPFKKLTDFELKMKKINSWDFIHKNESD